MQKFKNPSDIKVGVVGYGGAFNMGKKHLEEMKKAGMSPFAVCELDPQRLKVAGDDFPGIETYDSLDAMLKASDVNLLVHITPHHLHYPLARQCVKAGKHVVTEKPFVLTTSEADRLIKQATQHDVMVSTYHNRHWDGWILRAVREVAEKGVIGDVYKVEAHMGGYGMPKEWWRTSKSISGGILYDWGVHLLEYALQIIPSEATEVSGFAVEGFWSSLMKDTHPWKNDANEDTATAIVRFANGAFINLSISQLEANGPEHMLSFHGTKGYYGISNQGWLTRTPNRKGELVEKTGKHPKGQQQKFYQNIAEYLTGQAELIITPEWARRPIHLLDLAGKSAEAGRAMKVKYG
jgi:predicted dehydrogenase